MNDDEKRRLHAAAQADMAAGRWDTAVAKLEELARREAGHSSPVAGLTWPSVADFGRQPRVARAARAAPVAAKPQPVRVLVAYAIIALVMIAVAIIALDARHEAARSPRQDSTAAPRATAAAPASVTSQEAPPVASESTAQADAEPALGTSALETETQPAEAQAEPTLLEEASAETAAESSAPCVDRNGAPLPQDSWLCRGQVVHGAPPPANAPPTVGEQPAAPAEPAAGASAPIARVPPYQTASAQRLGAGTRVRYEVSVLVPADYGRDEMMAVLTHAVRQTLAQRHDAEAVGVFAYSSPVQIGKGYDKGRALVSRDGRGWTGDGTFDVLVPGLVDRGKIYVTLGTVLAAYEQAAVDR